MVSCSGAFALHWKFCLVLPEIKRSIIFSGISYFKQYCLSPVLKSSLTILNHYGTLPMPISLKRDLNVREENTRFESSEFP